jgi:CRP/FNR family transcriptional regulator, anaerobic regulatory protein
MFIQALHKHLLENSKLRTIKKGDFLIRAGEVEKHLYYIEDGAVMAIYSTDDEDLTIRFGYDGSFINSLASFLNGTPSEYMISAIKSTKLRQISKEGLMQFIHSSEVLMQGYQDLLQVLITQQMERELDLLTNSPAERLQRVLQRSPNLFQHIPLRHIASYLRMTPETLSRIRKS